MAPTSLLTAQDCSGLTHLVIGSGSLAASRCLKSIEAGANPTVVAKEDERVHYKLSNLVDTGKVKWIQRDFQEKDLTTLGRDEVEKVVDAVFVATGLKHPLSTDISSLCRRLRIPVNVVDAPNLCTFTLLTTYSDGPLQIGVTTSGRGCKLASRIQREIAASLPPKFGAAIERLGTIRRRIWEEDHVAKLVSDPSPDIEVA